MIRTVRGILILVTPSLRLLNFGSNNSHYSNTGGSVCYSRSLLLVLGCLGSVLGHGKPDELNVKQQ